ncbi:MAG TPA: DUF2924 domain-containing protein [Roseiarcus sp.]|nr:DUF2924 domain-containing protein [Roseiarcus sp.]
MATARGPVRRGVRPVADLGAELERIATMTIDELRTLWRARSGQGPPESFSKDLVARALAYRVQEQHLGGLDRQMRKLLASLATSGEKPPRRLKVGSVIIREHQGVTHEVLVVPGGFCWRGKTYSSLSTIAKAITGTTWNGPRFFGLKNGDEPMPTFGAPRQPATAPRKLASPRRSLSVVATGRTKSVALNSGGDL